MTAGSVRIAGGSYLLYNHDMVLKKICESLQPGCIVSLPAWNDSLPGKGREFTRGKRGDDSRYGQKDRKGYGSGHCGGYSAAVRVWGTAA